MTSPARNAPSFRPAQKILSGLIASTLAACAVGPNYTAPKSNFVAFHNQPALANRTAPQPPPPLDVWWTGFNDPMLVTIVQRALDQNLDLAAAMARVREARATAASAGADLLPTADFRATETVQRQSLESPLGHLGNATPGYSRDQRELNVGAAASWEIDLFGGLRRNAAAARAEFQAAQADQMGTRISVAADAADAYLQIRGLQARIGIAKGQVDTDAHLLTLVRLRHASGVSSDREQAEAEALLQQAQTTVPLLQITLEAQLNRLDVLMGAQPGTYAHTLSTLSPIPAPPAISATDTPLDVLRRRPDIIAAERRLAAANERIGASISDYYPKISISGALGFDSLNINHMFSAKGFQPVGTGAIRWRLFDFGKVDAEVAQARGANAEALATYREAALKAAEDVENAFITLTQTELRSQQLNDEVGALTRSRDLSQQSYQSGVIGLTDVLDADRELLAAQDDQANNQVNDARAAVSAFRALGGGWKS